MPNRIRLVVLVSNVRAQLLDEPQRLRICFAREFEARRRQRRQRAEQRHVAVAEGREVVGQLFLIGHAVTRP
jgi:hypothetical protein